MAYINDHILDNGLAAMTSGGNRLDICNAEPATYTAATATNTLGNKTSLSVGAPTARTPTGRKVVVAALTGGSVTGTGSASHYAVVDTVNSRLLAASSLSAAQAVTSGNTFSVGAFDIGIPGAV